MKSYFCGIDLSARSSHICILDTDLNIVKKGVVKNDLHAVIKWLAPYRDHMKTVVESTFNWYWLIDGLQDNGFDVCLAHTLGLYMITGAKVKTDKRDAERLAYLLRIGAIPKAYIYPKEHRPVRDLVRRRNRLVQMRGGEYGTIRRTLLRHGILNHSRYSVTCLDDSDMDELFSHPMSQLYAKQELERIRLYNDQISEMEKQIALQAHEHPEYIRLLKVPGIRHALAPTIFYEIGDIYRFKNARHFSSYSRLVPGVSQSGKITKKGRGSKQGNPHLKWAFSQAAAYAVRYYGRIRACFERQLSRHRGRARKLVVYNIIAHKLAVAVYHILRDGVDYNEEMLFGAANPGA